MEPKPKQSEIQPGADRFWGQFSRSQAGRSSSGSQSHSDESGGGDSNSANGSHSDACLEWCPICRSAELFRNTVSPELRQQAESIQHEAIGVLKAFLDAYAEKTSASPGGGSTGSETVNPEGEKAEAPPRVTDIPLD